MANTSNSDKWYFTKEQLENTPSRKCGFDAYKELQYRQQAANFIQDMGQRLQVSQLCINTAIVYMHRFYVFHSFSNFPWHQMAAAALFLAAKVEEQPRKLEYVIKVANICKNPRDRNFDINSERYIAQSQDLVFNENVLLQTLGFDVAIDHPHTYVVRCCHLVRASKDLAQTSYFMASNSLHLTTMCIQYKPTVVACFCILLACKWSNWEIPLSNEKKEWFTYVDQTVTAELLQQLTSEFLVIFENCPSRLKEKIMAKQESSGSPFEQDKKSDSSQRALEYNKGDDPHKHRSSRPLEASSSGHRSQEQREREYKERKEKERIAHMSGIVINHQAPHHRPPSDPSKMKIHSRAPSAGGPSFAPRDILREAAKDSPFGIPAMRDPFAPRSDKELVRKSDVLVKPQTDMNSLTNYQQQRGDPNRKSQAKPEMMRRFEEQKLPHVKSETETIKKHLSASFVDKTSGGAFVNKSSTSTSQKLSLDSKSVPRSNNAVAHVKPQVNGSNTNGSYGKPPAILDNDVKIKTEPVKEEIPIPQLIKRPSLFSPDQTPQQLPIKTEIKTEPIKTEPLDSVLSPMTSPISLPRHRNSSSCSEPELRPTMKKIDQVEGFENLMRDSTIGMAHINSVKVEPEEISVKTEPVSASSTMVNGLETNPTLISNLLKEAAATSHLSACGIKQEPVEQPAGAPATAPGETVEKEHRHHKSKKKKDKHKHKDKDKNREEKEKKKKHKDKDREKHRHKERKEEADSARAISEPITIKIQKNKIQPLNELKIKIPKDKIKTEGIVEPLTLSQSSSGGLKIKIPKDIIANCTPSNSSVSGRSSLDPSMSHSSRKRDRERQSPSDLPPAKLSKSSHKESKQNGRHSYSKVSESFEPVEENNNNEIAENAVVISPKDVSSTVEVASPTMLSPISPCDSILNALDASVNFASVPLSPISPSNSPSPVGEARSTLKEEHGSTPPPVLPTVVSTYQATSASADVQTSQYKFGYSNNNTFHSSSYKPRHFQKQYRHVNKYDYPPPQFQPKYRAPRHRAPRYPPHPVVRQNPDHSSYIPQNPDNSVHYPPPQMAFNPYQVPPPSLPNVSVPPPSLGFYPGYFGGFMYPEVTYQQQGYRGEVGQPPLPTDAPPVNEVPPPPPPE